jgi:glycosyltransferase involved in cell wall biosynthesis
MKKKSRILFILHIPPPIHGAAMVGKYIKESKIINHTFDTRYINLGTSVSLNELGNGYVKKIFRYLFILWQTFKQLIQFRPDLCYLTPTSQGIGFYKDVPFLLLVRLFHIKAVYHYHNKGISSRQNIWFDNYLYQMVFKKSKVILLSKYLYSDIQKYVSSDSVYYCANGIPEIDLFPLIPKVNNKVVNILFLSNLIESKGVFILLEACKLLKERQIPFNCIFVGGEGDVTQQQFENKTKQLGLVNCVKYMGKKYGKDKEEIFLSADIFAFPTYYYNETFGLVNLEAMQFSLPIVSTFEGGIPDVVEDGKTGFLVHQKDIKALSEKLEILIANKDLRIKMGIAGQTKFEKEFTLKRFENRINDILNKIVLS